MNLVWHVLIVCIIANLVGCAQPNDSAADNLGSLSGLVLDAATELPIAEAEVRALINDVADTTDSLGMFLLEDLELGSDTLRVITATDTHYTAIDLAGEPQQTTLRLDVNNIIEPTKIAYANSQDMTVHFMNFDGTGEQIIAYDNITDNINAEPWLDYYEDRRQAWHSDGPRWSPSGSRLAFRFGIGYQMMLISMDIQTGVGAVASYNIVGPVKHYDWAPDESKIVYSMSLRCCVFGFENIQVFITDLLADTTYQITYLNVDYEYNVDVKWGHDDSRIYILNRISGYEDGGTKVYEYDLTTKSIEQVAYWQYGYSISGDGRYMVGSDTSTVMHFDITTGETTILTPGYLPRYTRDDKFIMYLRGPFVDHRVWLYSLTDSTAEQLPIIPQKNSFIGHNIDIW